MTDYVFDGSLEGLLTAIFEYYERKPGGVRLVEQARYTPAVFGEALTIHNDETKARRVWKGLSQKLDREWLHRFYCTALSEQAESFQHLFDFACYIFSSPPGAAANYGNEHVLAVARTDRKVQREKHRMEAFIRFRQTAEGLFYAHIDPDFNVLPLISRHFKNRYADQQWVIYDLRRKYGIFYDLNAVHEVTFCFTKEADGAMLSANLLHEQEELYTLLWKDYFRSTNIPARKNMKLHIQHVPKRYWKYLTEKQE